MTPNQYMKWGSVRRSTVTKCYGSTAVNTDIMRELAAWMGMVHYIITALGAVSADSIAIYFDVAEYYSVASPPGWQIALHEWPPP